MGMAPFRYREHPQWPRRRASHILGDIVPRRGHDADLGLPERSGGVAATATGYPVTWLGPPGNCIDHEIADAPNVRRRRSRMPVISATRGNMATIRRGRGTVPREYGKLSM